MKTKLRARNNRNIFTSSSFPECFFEIKAEFQDTSILNANLVEYLHFIRTRKNGMRAVQTICYDRFLFFCFKGLLFRLSYTKPLLLNGAFDWRYLWKPIWFSKFPQQIRWEKKPNQQKHTIYITVCINIYKAFVPGATDGIQWLMQWLTDSF